MRRPIDGVMGFLAQTEEGLNKLISDALRPDQIIRIERNIERHILFGAHVAKVYYRRDSHEKR
jgi:hypothetical protein